MSIEIENNIEKNNENKKSPKMKSRFRGFLPIIVDIETSGLDPQKNAVLEIAAVTVKMEENGKLVIDKTFSEHVAPFEGAKIDKEALEFNKIDLDHPFRLPISEKETIDKLFAFVSNEVKDNKCSKAILVGHNAWFDLHFMNAAAKRVEHKKNPFHSFSSLDTASLSALAFKQTVLAKSCHAAKIKFEAKEAHSAIYDAEKTAELFCKIINLWDFRE